MDLEIKTEPCVSKEMLSDSCEYLDEEPFDQKVVIAETSVILETNVCKNQTAKVGNKFGKAADDRKSDELSYYSRKVLLRAFQQEGCSRETIENYCTLYNYNSEMANEYFANSAIEAQHFVREECNSLSFNNITEWLNFLKTSGVQKECNYEAAIYLNAIANNEYHPEPKLLSGINIKAIYKFLSNALMGLPQPQLDEVSAKFLSNEFQNLIDKANTDAADNDVRKMKTRIEEFLSGTFSGKANNLDPLNTQTEKLKRNYLFIKNDKE